MLESVQAIMVEYLRWMKKQFCWRIRSDVMRKAQLQFGKRYLRRGTEVKKHGNVASFHLASRCIHSNLRRKGWQGSPSREESGRWGQGIHITENRQKEAAGVTEQGCTVNENPLKDRMTGEQLRDKKTREQRPSNTTVTDKEKEENIGQNNAKKRQGPWSWFKNYWWKCSLLLFKDISYTLNLRLFFLFNKIIRVILMRYTF